MSNPPDLATDELVALFKALADPTRLRLAALIVDRARCGQDLAAELGVSTGTVSHHLRVLREANLVRETRQPPFSFFELELATLQQALRAVSSKKLVREIAVDDSRTADERKVLRTFFDGPRLTALPVQRKKKQVVLEEVLRRIPRRKEYEERELSRYIETIFQDFCTVRREWIMGGYMAREAGIYRLTDRGREVVAR
ncbi:MAG TPA: metalloregulator ArsR/SmtB family transcription factor [Kofleriaceae bacterium]|nr:metalloregulator ArsR/SmtB family transcription factor [Kofleriaceae bacterium]